MKGKRIKQMTGKRVRPPVSKAKLPWETLVKLAIILVLVVILIAQIISLVSLDREMKQLSPRVDVLEEKQEQLEVLVVQSPKEEPSPDVQAVLSDSGFPEPSPPLSMLYAPTGEELEMLAKVVYREARGIEDPAQQAAVIWCILNRVDTHSSEWGDTIKSVITYPNAFAWIPNTPVETKFLLLAADVCERWNLEKAGATQVGRTLPSTYLFFTGDGKVNNFTEEWKGAEYWDWSLPSPY